MVAYGHNMIMAQEVGIAPTPSALQADVQTNYTIPGIKSLQPQPKKPKLDSHIDLFLK